MTYPTLNEVWKNIPGFPKYEASTSGQIRSKRTGRILSASANNKGYLLTTLSFNQAPCRALVHRLVMLAFIGPSHLQVNHKNGDKADNRLDNLEYVEAAANVRHAMTVLGVRYGGDRRRIPKVEP